MVPFLADMLDFWGHMHGQIGHPKNPEIPTRINDPCRDRRNFFAAVGHLTCARVMSAKVW